VAEGMSADNKYVAKMLLNGRPLERSFLRHEEIMRGGELRFVMGAVPNKTWAIQKGSRPYSMSSDRSNQ